MEHYWIENIYYTINGFASVERQKKAWRGLDTSIISSFIEDYNLLFFSFDFDDFIENWEIEKMDNTVLLELVLFRNMLKHYEDEISEDMRFDDIKILEDLNWISIVNQAKIVIFKWNSVLPMKDISDLPPVVPDMKP